MAIHAITGVMGSGKSYEAVSEKIVVTLRDEQNRRVVTNIEGLNYEAIAKYIKKPLDYVKSHLISVDYDRVSQPDFWYDPEGGERNVVTNNPRITTSTTDQPVFNSIVQPGDLVVLDEIWRYFNRNIKIPDDAMRFFRMHRHYVGANGITCDVVLINQSFRGIHKDISDVIELQFACRKLKVLGRPQNYQVFLHEGGERKASHVYLRKYSTAVFELYSSYKSSNAKESIDKRQNLLSTPFFKFVIPLTVLAIAGCGFYVYRHFATLGQSSMPTASSASAPPATASAPVATPHSGSSSRQELGDWRVAAMYYVNDLPVIILTDNAGRYRTVTSGHFSRGASNDISVEIPPVATQHATPWTGPAPSFGAPVVQQGVK